MYKRGVSGKSALNITAFYEQIKLFFFPSLLSILFYFIFVCLFFWYVCLGASPGNANFLDKDNLNIGNVKELGIKSIHGFPELKS